MGKELESTIGANSMSEFYEQMPNYVEKREDKESLKWVGKDHSFEMFPHLNLDWRQLKEVYDKSKKPIGDLGSSFSIIPVEGELRRIDIIPIDITHEADRSRYEAIMRKNFQFGVVNSVYQRNELPDTLREAMGLDKRVENYWETVDAAIEEVMNKYIIADLSHIPLADRSLSITITHDTLPKHSQDLKTFLEQQLPEILRVTDQTAYIYPMSIYKTILWWLKYDQETGEEDWKKLSEWTPEEITYEKNMAEGRIPQRRTLEEWLPLYRDPETLKTIAEVVERLGFEFKLEKGSETEREIERRKHEPHDPPLKSYDEFTGIEQEEAKLGVFTRRS